MMGIGRWNPGLSWDKKKSSPSLWMCKIVSKRRRWQQPVPYRDSLFTEIWHGSRPRVLKKKRKKSIKTSLSKIVHVLFWRKEKLVLFSATFLFTNFYLISSNKWNACKQQAIFKMRERKEAPLKSPLVSPFTFLCKVNKGVTSPSTAIYGHSSFFLNSFFEIFNFFSLLLFLIFFF